MFFTILNCRICQNKVENEKLNCYQNKVENEKLNCYWETSQDG